MRVQLKKGVLELCVLSILNDQDTYGYNIYQIVNKIMGISESTIYPILRKLVTSGYVNTYLKPSSSGPARKYFTLTDVGKAHCVTLKHDWLAFRKQVEKIIGSDVT